MRSYLVVVKV